MKQPDIQQDDEVEGETSHGETGGAVKPQQTTTRQWRETSPNSRHVKRIMASVASVAKFDQGVMEPRMNGPTPSPITDSSEQSQDDSEDGIGDQAEARSQVPAINFLGT